MLKQQEEEETIFFPEEMLLDVFARLPTKSAMRFRTVSKSMCEIMKEKFFIDLHCEKLSNLRSKQSPLFFTSRGIGDEISMIGFCLQEGRECSRKDPTISSYILPFRAVNHNGWPDSDRDFDFACSCNGLVCIRPEDGAKPVIVCNPLTLEFTTLPPCNPHGRSFGFGLGYGSATKEYKVACLGYGAECYQFSSSGKLMVYTLGRDTPWREVGRVPLFDLNKPPVYADGHVCWLLLHKASETSYLLFYSVDTDEVLLLIWNMPGVALSMTNFDRVLLVELEGRVSLAFHDDTSIEIWMQTDRHDMSRGWIRRHKIQTWAPPPPNKLMIRNYNLPWMIGIREREEGLHIWFQDHTVLLLYDDRKNVNDDDVKFQEYEAPDLGDDEPVWRSCPNYRPSLVSLQQYYNCNTGAKGPASTRWAEPPPKIPLPRTAKPLIRLEVNGDDEFEPMEADRRSYPLNIGRSFKRALLWGFVGLEILMTLKDYKMNRG